MVAKVIAGIMVSFFVIGAANVYAVQKPTKAEKFEHADKNDDGKVDRKEMKMERRFEAKQKSEVNTAVEKRYDANNDGVINPAEAKEMLKDKYTLISTEGKAKVDSPLEAQYDTNQDGVIDSSEAAALLAALND
ncbi:MAG: hypothetical protein WCY10_06810 [Candidatus Omnitrophota bacterium]